jgi:aryl-alcohol dehydrogenase-like predicted oxidoreductase
MRVGERERVIEGFATASATAAYHRRVTPEAPAEHFRSWAGLQISSIGIGTYLGGEDDGTDRDYQATIARALELGFNVVDSAVNYRHQRSERSVGEALRSSIEKGTIKRDEVVLATKGGFIPFDGAVPPDPNLYLRDTYVRTGILQAREVVGNCHCISPRYLSDQLERSRGNLGVQTIDVYYLHNPETQLSEVDRPTFLARMQAAFEFLEGAVADGKIRLYGTATWNGYRQPPTAPDALSLPELTRMAAEIAGDDHHFRVIQLPYNLAMTEAFTRANQVIGDEAVSALEAARRLGIYVMTSASIYQGQLARNLPPVISDFLPGLETDAQRALQFVRSTPGVGTALVGMKQATHVNENARLVSVPPVPWDEFSKLFSAA